MRRWFNAFLAITAALLVVPFVVRQWGRLRRT